MNKRSGKMSIAPCTQSFTNILFLLIISLLVWSNNGHAAEPVQLAELNKLSPYFGGQKVANDITVSDQDSCPVKITKLAALYRSRPDQYRNDFFEALVIDDYAERDKGVYNYVGGSQVGDIVGQAIHKFGKPDDSRFEPVIAFCHIRHENLWVNTQERGRISLGRFMRGALLAALLENTDENPVAIANAIDRRTVQRYERNKNK